VTGNGPVWSYNTTTACIEDEIKCHAFRGFCHTLVIGVDPEASTDEDNDVDVEEMVRSRLAAILRLFAQSVDISMR